MCKQTRELMRDLDADLDANLAALDATLGWAILAREKVRNLEYLHAMYTLGCLSKAEFADLEREAVY